MKSCLPYATEALKVSFIINVLGAGLEAALPLLSIIHLLSIEHTPILQCQIRHEVAKEPAIRSPSLIKRSQRRPQTPALKTINNATLTRGSQAICNLSVIPIHHTQVS